MKIQSATADAPEIRSFSNAVPGAGAILSAGALLQVVAMVARLKPAVGEPDATERRVDGGSSAADLDDAAGGTAGRGGGDAGGAGGPGGGRPGRRGAGCAWADTGPGGSGGRRSGPGTGTGPRWSMCASPAGSRFLSIRNRPGCSMRWPSGQRRWAGRGRGSW